MPITDYDVPAAIPDNADDVGVGDFIKGPAAATADVGSNLSAAGRFTFDDGQSGGDAHAAQLFQGLQEIFGSGADIARSGLSPQAKRLAESTLTSKDFWEHPYLATSLKAANMLPSAVALAIPGGLLTDTLAASMAAGAGGGLLNTGAGVDEFYQKLDSMSDEELQKQSPKYAALREVMDEQSARARFAREAQGWAPAINAIVGMGATIAGPAGTAARRLAGGTANVLGSTADSALRSGAVAGVEGAIGNAVQAGTGDVLAQNSDIEANFRKDLDAAHAANAALEGGALGGLTGALAGAVLHGHTSSPAPAGDIQPEARSADTKETVATTDTASPQPSTGRASTEPSAPVVSDKVGNPQSAPTQSETVYQKVKKKNAAKKAAGSKPVSDTGPDAAQSAALDATNPAGTGAAPDVAGALARLTGVGEPGNDADTGPAPAGAQPVGNATATPEVTAALQRLQTPKEAPQEPVQAPPQNTSQEGPSEPLGSPPVASPQPGVLVPEQAPVAQTATPPRTGRILRDLRQVDETAPIKPVVEKVDNGPQGKRYSEKDRAALDERLKATDKIIADHQPTAAEDDYARKIPARDAVVARARAMVKAAEDGGVKIQKILKKSTKGDSASDHPGTQVLTEAKSLVALADKKKQGKALTDAVSRFKTREVQIHAGMGDDVLAERRAEGDEKMNRRRADERAADTSATSETDVPEEKIVEATPQAAAKEAEDQITTATKASKRPVLLDDGTEEREVINKATGKKDKVEGAKAASGDKLDADAKAKLMAEYNAKFSKGVPERAPKIKKAEEVNVNPSEAQKLAGNYKKGHRRVEGLDFTIENPKGAIRRGRDADGKEWQAKMPADYGYIRGTTGADGDHIDAYDLKSGNRYFVVDQLDHKTGDFDEHKLVLRAKSESDVRDVFHRAFTDGRGEERIGHVHELTASELKDWLKEGDHEQPHIAHVIGEEDRTFTPPKGDTVQDTLVTPEGKRIKAQRSDYLSNELQRFDFSKVKGVGGVLAKFFKDRFQKLADQADHVVHYVKPEDMEQLIPHAPDALGYHNIDHNGFSHIVLRNDLRDNGVEHGSLGHVLLHETAHAFTVREIEDSAAARNIIKHLMRTAAEWMEHPDHAPHVELIYGSQSPRGDATRYAFTNEKEFIAEAFSNRDFQELLTQIPVTNPAVRDYLGLTGKRNMSVWDMFRGFVKKAIEKVTGKLPQFDSVLDAVMKVGEGLEMAHNRDYLGAARDLPAKSYAQGEAFRLQRQGQDAVKRLLEDVHANTAEGGPKVLKLRTFNNIAEIADHYFGENNPVRKIHNAIERMRVHAEKLFQNADPLIRRLVDLRAKDAEGFREFSSLLHDATVANVHPDVGLNDAKNAHLGKNRTVGTAVWSKAQHPELAARYRELSPELQEAWHDVTKYFRDQQNAMSLGIIQNRVLKLLGHEDAGLAQRIHEGNLTDSDRKTLGEDMVGVLEDAGELSKIEGPYVPLMRRGDHVVKGDYRIAQPAGTKLVNSNEFEFNDDKAATDYAKNSPLRATIAKVWVDEHTGETTRPDGTKVSAKDLDAVPRYRVLVNNRHVEFVHGRAAAERRAKELAENKNIDVHKVVPRAFEVSGRQATELSASLQRLVSKLEKSEAYKQSSPSQQAALRSAISEAAAASHGSTRIASKALPRRGVEGYSEDLVRNTGDYAESSSRYLAKLQHMPKVEEGMKEMEEQLKANEKKRDQYGRTMIRNEVVRRVNGDNGYFDQGGKFAPFVKRAMAVSFIDKLASPAYSVINAMQPGMVTMPYLGGRHGIGRAAAALGRAYSDISAGKIIKQGFAETGRRLKGKAAPDDFITNAKASLKDAGERRMLDYMVEHGVVDPSAGMEIRALIKDYAGVGGKVDAGLGYLEGVTREMPRAIEAINRMTTALAAYRLEKAKGASHDAAVKYAQDAVNNTQFNYSPTNAPPVFNHPLAKMAFQFKKYGQGIYQLIGGQIGKAYRNASPGDRAQAVKTLITLAGTHMAVAGALGLPTEPFKFLVMASSLVGGPQWGDVEDKIRKVAADVLGKTGGEVFTRGLPRLIDLDLSRVGLDSVMTFGEPRAPKEDDVKAWLFDTISGPVASLGVDYGKAINAASNGDFEKAAELMIPIKAASDSLRAYRQATEGKVNARGQQTSAPYNLAETAMRVAGFGSGREAEEGASASRYYRQKEEQDTSRNALVNGWVNAKPAEKAKAMAAITKWNMGQERAVRITPRELTSKLHTNSKQAKDTVRGIHTNKRTAHIERDNPYNVN